MKKNIIYEFLKYHDGSKFYPVKVEEINELEKKLNLTVPKELKDLLLGIGYGFIKGSENNINRIMDTESIRDFRLRKGDFEFYPEIEIYDEYEDGKLIFFEGRESALISIELTDGNSSNIFYYDVKIADSLEEFLLKIQEDDNYYFVWNYICLFDYLFISSQMTAKPYFIGSTGILLLW